MSVYTRYFTADGNSPLFAAVSRILEVRRTAFATIKDFIAEIGATQMYGSSPATYCFDFASDGSADKTIWKQTPKRRGAYYYVPRTNTPEGKAMAARIKCLPEFPALKGAIKEALPELNADIPIIVDSDGSWTSPHVRFYSMRDPQIVLLQIPWREVSQEKLDTYREQISMPADERSEWNCELDYLTQEIPSWLREIKEWEALRLIDEAGARA